MISVELTKEFQEALKEEYGKDVTIEDASRILSDLTGYFDTLSRVYYRMQNKEGNAIITLPD
jgi:hypothetical protein